MGHIVALERPEPAEERHSLTRVEPDYVFFAGVVWMGVGTADALKHCVFFHVHVHRVCPAAAAVLYRPQFALSASVRQREWGKRVELHTVDHPLRLAANCT